MTDDLAGVTGSAVSNVAADPEYAAWDETVPEAKVSGMTIPPFQFYLVQPFTGKLRDLKAGRTPSGRVGVKVVNGIAGTIGERLFGDLYLGVSTEKNSDEVGPGGRAVRVPKTAEELQRGTTFFQHTLNRLAQAMGLALKRPVSKQQGALETYIGQFDGDDRPAFLIEVGIENGFNGQPRNVLKWDTARNPNEPACDPKLKAQGFTSLQEAEKRIAERNTIEAQKAGKTAASAVTGAGVNGHGKATLD